MQFTCPWWFHQMETFSLLLALCAGNSPVTGKFPSQRRVTRSFDVFFDLRLNKRLIKQMRVWWFEMPSRSLWCQCNADGWNEFYLVLNKKKTNRSITLFFSHLFHFIPLHSIKKLPKIHSKCIFILKGMSYLKKWCDAFYMYLQYKKIANLIQSSFCEK